MTPISSIQIDAVADQLDAVAGRAQVRGDRLGMFAALYRQTTRAIGARVAAGQFDDGDRMGRLVTGFAARYTGPVEAWLGGRPVPRCWRVAFEATASTEHVILQHLLMGLNAHINLDLGVSAAQVCPGPEIHALHDDFMRVNDVLAALLPRVRAAVGAFSPLLDVIDRVGGADDDEVLNFSIRVARDEAWRAAVSLASTGSDAQRTELVDALDRRIAVLARVVAHPGGLMERAVDVVAATESDDVAAVIEAMGRVALPPP